jgi:hypothetical protein
LTIRPLYNLVPVLQKNNNKMMKVADSYKEEEKVFQEKQNSMPKCA